MYKRQGLHIIQTFEPHPLYAVMEGLGYEHHTEQRSEAEFHVWFCRVEKKDCLLYTSRCV